MNGSQSALCDRFDVQYQPSEAHLKVGIALATLAQQPLNALRHPPVADTTGWYIWGGGEIPLEDDFFQPVHVSHLDELLPEIVPYLGLPAGWRVQVAPGHEDVWFDASLLDLS